MRPRQREDAREARTLSVGVLERLRIHLQHEPTAGKARCSNTHHDSLEDGLLLLGEDLAIFRGHLAEAGDQRLGLRPSTGSTCMQREGRWGFARQQHASSRVRTQARDSDALSPHNPAQRRKRGRLSPARAHATENQCAADGRGARRRRGFTTFIVAQTRPHLLGAVAQVLPASAGPDRLSRRHETSEEIQKKKKYTENISCTSLHPWRR
jgi:hypothetical protein